VRAFSFAASPRKLTTASGRATGRRLGEAFLLHMLGRPMLDHPRLAKLLGRDGAGRNVCVNLYEEPRVVTFPAGYILSLRQPVTIGNRAAWEALEQRVKLAGSPASLRLAGVSEGFILKLPPSGAVLRERVAIAHATTLLLHLQDVLDLICESGVVPAEKEYRLTVMPIELLAGGRLTRQLPGPLAARHIE